MSRISTSSPEKDSTKSILTRKASRMSNKNLLDAPKQVVKKTSGRNVREASKQESFMIDAIQEEKSVDSVSLDSQSSKKLDAKAEAKAKKSV